MSIQPDVVIAGCPVCGQSLVGLDHIQRCVDELKAEITALKKGLDGNEWAKAVSKAADGLWEEGKHPTQFSERPVSEILKVLSTNLHRLVQNVQGVEMLPPPGARLH